MSKESKTFKNPLLVLWNILGTTGGIISFSSMIDDWADDLIEWKGFILRVIESYREVVRPVFECLFWWLWFEIPFWVQDYFVMGAIVVASDYRSGNKTIVDFFPDIKQMENWVRPFCYASITFVMLLFWPFLVATYPLSVWLYFKRRRGTNFVKHSSFVESQYRATCWIAAVSLGFVVLLAINAVL